MVYLTTAYAPYFAIMSAKAADKGLIVEVSTAALDADLLYPDEDFIAQALAYKEKRPLEQVHREVWDGIEDYKHHAADSVQGMGNCAHRGPIPAKAITRYAVIDPKLQSQLFWIGLDPSISVLNYRFCGAKYRSIIAWIFGDREDFDDGMNSATYEMMDKVSPEYMANLRKLWANRKGISVIKTGVSND